MYTIQHILGNDYNYTTSKRGKEAIDLFRNNIYSLVIIDKKLPDLSGVDVLREMADFNPNLGAIILTGHADLDSAVESMKIGALDYISKGDSNLSEKLQKKVAEAMEKRKLDEEKNFIEMVVHEFPSFLSETYYELKNDLEPILKFKTQIHLFESILKFFSIVVISEYFSADKRLPDLDSQVRKNIFVPGLGDWFNMANELYKRRKEFSNYFFLDMFSGFFTGKNRKLMSDFIEIRNNKWAHAGQLSDYEYKILSDKCSDILLALISDLTFLKDFLLCKIVNLRIIKKEKIYKLIECRGVHPKLSKSERPFKNLLPSEEVILIHSRNENYQTLYPFIILEDCDQCGQLEIFIYSRTSHKNLYYLSPKTGHQLITDAHSNVFFELVEVQKEVK